MTQGIDTRHQRTCAKRAGGKRCNCKPTFQAHVFDKKTGRRVRKTFESQAAAKLWRQDALVKLRIGQLDETRAKLTVENACERWMRDARAGIITTRSGDPYKPGALYGYHQALKHYVYPELGTAQFYAVKLVDLQDMVDKHVAAGTKAGTIQKPVGALRSIYKRAMQRGEIAINPTTGLKMPANRSSSRGLVAPADAVRLIAAVPEQDRALWATAFYAGLRRGELMALRWTDIEDDVINVRRGWDLMHGPIATKSRRHRRVPIPTVLRGPLKAQRIRQPPDVELCFGTAPGVPFKPQHVQGRADKAWETASLHRVTFHPCRHTYASFGIAAGLNAKALSEYMGHASIQITFDLYGHLMPGNEKQAAGLLDRYLKRASSA